VSERRVFAGLSRERQVALVCAGLLLVAILGYFVLISPKRSTAHNLSAEKAQVEAQIERNRASALARNLPAIRAAHIFRLTKAIPDDVAMADVILELNQLAQASGISFDEIAPQSPTSETGYDIHPIALTFSGNFYSLADFLFRLRNLVQVHDKKLITRGRMFALSGLSFSEGEKHFPQIKAELTVDAFVLGSAGANSSSSATTASTSTTTTPAPSTAQPASASAAPATPTP
jgi:Tfp pilus assembly protein PilO